MISSVAFIILLGVNLNTNVVDYHSDRNSMAHGAITPNMFVGMVNKPNGSRW